MLKQGDTLSTIAHRNFEGRVYGQNGSLSKLISFNPQIKNPNIIIVGQSIELGETLNPDQSLAKVPEAPEQLTVPSTETKDRLPAEESWAKQTYLRLSPVLGYRRIDSTIAGSSATALSNLGYGLNLDWQQRWDDTGTWRTSLGLKVMSYNFEVSDNKTLSDPSQMYSKLYLSGSYHYGEAKEHFLSAALGIDREQILAASSGSDLGIESLLVPSLELYSRHRILNHKSLSAYFDAALGSALSSSGTVNTKTSIYWQTGLGLSYKRAWGTVESGINFKNLDLSLENADQTTKDFGIILGVGFDL
ncbi:LysM domain-containing protein [Bacteriovoracaceae bacterium]|nr:LysM domain-containing protein [Bacteriovoracaceae bacterium]